MEENLYCSDDGQMTFFPITTRTSNVVAQANPLIKARQNLTLNQKRLILVIMMQIVANDVAFKPYEISPSTLAEMFDNTDSSNYYHRAQEICRGLMKKQLEIRSADGSWKLFQWVQTSEYDARIKKIRIMLNPDLKPFLLRLVETGNYTQYILESAIGINSIYAVRMFELLQEEMKLPPNRPFPSEGVYVTLDKQTIIDGLMLYKLDSKEKIIFDKQTGKFKERYPKISRFKEVVIQKACEEITENTEYYVPYDDKETGKKVTSVKKGREITGFTFYVNLKEHEKKKDKTPAAGDKQYIRIYT